MNRAALAAALALAALTVTVPAHATPATGCTSTTGGYTLNTCEQTFTYPAGEGDRWLVVFSPGTSGSPTLGPVYLKPKGGTIGAPFGKGCTGQWDVRETKKPGGPAHHIVGQRFTVPGCGTPTPTPTETPTPTPSTPSHTSTTHPTSSTTSKSVVYPPKSGRTATHRARTSPSPATTVRQAELANTGINPWLAVIAAGLIAAGCALIGARRKGEHS